MIDHKRNFINTNILIIYTKNKPKHRYTNDLLLFIKTMFVNSIFKFDL